MLKDLVKCNRTYRRFFENAAISTTILEELIDLTRYCASGANKQPLKYMISCEREKNAKIFAQLSWAAYLTEWQGPEPGERPSAYIIVLHDKQISLVGGIDHGIAAQTILLGAVEQGLGGCILASVQREELRKVLNISDQFEILLVLALGKPKEEVVIDPLGKDGDVRYWRDAKQVHHVPKRTLEDIIIK